MEGVVPNSKVVIKPPPLNPLNGEQMGAWKKRLYLRPGNWIPWVTVAVVGTMFLVSLIVLVLHINEKVRLSFGFCESLLICWMYSEKMKWRGGKQLA
jgi:hypothetical protein